MRIKFMTEIMTIPVRMKSSYEYEEDTCENEIHGQRM